MTCGILRSRHALHLTSYSRRNGCTAVSAQARSRNAVTFFTCLAYPKATLRQARYKISLLLRLFYHIPLFSPLLSPLILVHFQSPPSQRNMEKTGIETGETDVDSIDIEQNRGRIHYAANVGRRETRLRSMSGRRSSMDSLSIRPARRSIDPSLILPPQYRTM